MAATYGLRKHQATMASAGKPEAVAERKIAREANKRAVVECKQKFPELTAENFEAAYDFQRERTAIWIDRLTA